MNKYSKFVKNLKHKTTWMI